MDGTGTPLNRIAMLRPAADKFASHASRSGGKARQKLDQLIPVIKAAEAGDHPVFVLAPLSSGFQNKISALLCEIKRLDTTIALRLAPFGKATLLECIHQGHEIGALDAENFCCIRSVSYTHLTLPTN